MDGETRAAVLSLGEQITASLDQHDMLARWMAHYLAERLQALEGLNGEKRAEAEREVADLITGLWRQRHTVPMHDDPLSLTDSVVRAVAQLDPEGSRNRFFGRFDENAGPSQAEAEANASLKLALELDVATGQLVRSLIHFAARIAVDHDEKWIRSAEAMRDTTFRNIRRVLDVEKKVGDDSLEAEQTRIAERAITLGTLMQAITHEFSSLVADKRDSDGASDADGASEGFPARDEVG